jgi:hypothetical protein
MTTIALAAQALHAVAPHLTPTQRQILLGQCLSETYFGDYVKAPDGSSSNNWGAIYAQGDLGVIPSHDTFEGKKVPVNFAWNSTPEVGAQQFYNLIGSYSGALASASAGELFDYCEKLWRKGPCGAPWPTTNCGNSYYVGYPPGDKRGLAPADVVPGSAEDRWYRIKSYASFISGGASKVAAALGEPRLYRISPPAKPPRGEAAGGGNGLLLAGGVGLVAYLLWKKRKGGR